MTGELPVAGEFHCPASAEEGYRKTCAQCQACSELRVDCPGSISILDACQGPQMTLPMIYSAAYSESQLEGRWSLAGSTLHKDPVARDHSQAAGFFRARVEPRPCCQDGG